MIRGDGTVSHADWLNHRLQSSPGENRLASRATHRQISGGDCLLPAEWTAGFSASDSEAPTPGWVVPGGRVGLFHQSRDRIPSVGAGLRSPAWALHRWWEARRFAGSSARCGWVDSGETCSTVGRMALNSPVSGSYIGMDQSSGCPHRQQVASRRRTSWRSLRHRPPDRPALAPVMLFVALSFQSRPVVSWLPCCSTGPCASCGRRVRPGGAQVCP